MIHTHEPSLQKICIQHTSNVDITPIYDAVKELLLEVLNAPVGVGALRNVQRDAVMKRFKQIFEEV